MEVPHEHRIPELQRRYLLSDGIGCAGEVLLGDMTDAEFESILTCADPEHMGEHACQNRGQCWEPCGELGKSEAHARVVKPAETGTAPASRAREVTFFVPGQPVAKGRPIAGRGFGGRTTLRTPEKTVAYEGLVAHACHVAMNGLSPFSGPLAAIFVVYVQIPASWSKKRQARANEGSIAPTKKPDIDNVVKALCDAMNGIAYKDDAQIIEMRVMKYYGDTPGVHVRLYPMDKEAA